MEGFKEYEIAEKIFAENDCIGSENCIFFARKDANQQGMKAGLSSTLGIAGSAVAEKIGKSDALEYLYYDALLINQTEKGFGFVPLWAKGISLTLNVDKMEAKVNNYFFIGFDNIESVTVKNSNIFNHKMKTLRLFLKNGSKIQLCVSLTEKEIPYHAENFARFLQKFDTK